MERMGASIWKVSTKKEKMTMKGKQRSGLKAQICDASTQDHSSCIT